MKKLISLFTAALMTVGMSVPALAADINVTVDNRPVAWTDARPFIDENSRTLVPLRPIANALGLEVAWNDDTNTASFTDGETTAEFVVGSNECHAFLNNYDMHTYLEMDTTPVIKDSRIFAPARYLAESFQYVVGWNQTTQTVFMTKETAPDEEVIMTPVIPEGEKYVAEPMVTDAGVTAVSTVTLKGMVEDPDIIEYNAVLDSPVDSVSHGILMEDGYIVVDFQPEMNTAPGEYMLTWTLPGGWFEDGEDVAADIRLIVQEATVVSAMTAAFNDLSGTTFYTEEGATAEEINAMIVEDFFLFNDTPFVLELSGGEMIQDEYGDDIWDFIATVTNTDTGETFTCAAYCGLAYN